MIASASQVKLAGAKELLCVGLKLEAMTGGVRNPNISSLIEDNFGRQERLGRSLSLYSYSSNSLDATVSLA